MIKSEVGCTSEIKSRFAMAKATFKRKKTFFHWQIGLKFEEEPSKVQQSDHSFVWY